MNQIGSQFQLWVYLHGGPQPRFDIRFSASTGRGLFRTPQTSGLSSAPAGTTGLVKGLDTTEIGQTSFIYVDKDRHHFHLSAVSVNSLLHMPIGDWIRLVPDSQGTLTLDPATSHPPPSPSIRQRSSSAPTADSTRQSAAEYILKLEAERERDQRHINALKERIIELEESISSLGGVVSPLILNRQTSSDEERG